LAYKVRESKCWPCFSVQACGASGLSDYIDDIDGQLFN